MKKFFKLVFVSALAAAVYGAPVANANTATPEECVANDLTLVYDLSELNFDADTLSVRLKNAFQRGVFASQAVSVGASFDLPDAGVPGLFIYAVDDVVYRDSDPFVIPATSEDTITVKVRFAAEGTLAKGVTFRNGAIALSNFITLLYTPNSNGGYETPTAYVNLFGDSSQFLFPTSLSPANGPLYTYLNAMDSSAAETFSTRDGYTLRGFEFDIDNTEHYPTVSVDSSVLSRYALTPSNGFNMATLNTWPYTSGTIELEAAFAQNCDAETTVIECDTSNPTKAICRLSVGENGEVTYKNSCCAGYSPLNATTTE